MTGQRGKELLPEHLAARLWRRRAWRRMLKTQDGRRLRVLYPGRANGGPGPDFRDAILQWEDSPPVRGDVELHLETKGWLQHGHHRDPNYNNVMLHVVQATSGDGQAYRQDGRAVPTAVVPLPSGLAQEEATVGSPAGARLPLLQRWQRLPADELATLLDRAGDERFLSRSSRFRAEIAKEGWAKDSWDELCYRGIMEAMGYSRNRRQFIDLAHRLPWRAIREATAALEARQRGPAIQDLLMRAAGLQSAPNGKRFPQDPATVPMDPSAWCYAGVRPANQPHRRIAGAAALQARHVEEGLLASLAPLALGPRLSPLLGAFAVSGPDGTLIGRSRALDMVVNAVLPLLHARARMEGDQALADTCMRLYRSAPRLADNEITREMAALLHLQRGRLQPELRGMGAARQQGLLHLYGLMLQSGDSANANALQIRESATPRYRYNHLLLLSHPPWQFVRAPHPNTQRHSACGAFGNLMFQTAQRPAVVTSHPAFLLSFPAWQPYESARPESRRRYLETTSYERRAGEHPRRAAPSERGAVAGASRAVRPPGGPAARGRLHPAHQPAAHGHRSR